MQSVISSTELPWTGPVALLLISLLHLVAFCEPAVHLSLDFVVIGGGSEGSIVAKRLTENSNWSVLISEPINYADGSDFYFVAKTNETCLAHRQQSCQWPRHDRSPKLYVRGVPEDYDRWLKKGNQDWGWNQLLPYFEKSIAESGCTHMPGSYVGINKSELYSQGFEVMEKLFLLNNLQSKSHGLDHTAETGFRNLPYIEVRHSEAISRRSNLYVLKYAEPKRINFVASGKRVKSVTFALPDKQEMVVEVKKELVLAAGAIESAKLLMLSGVGDQQHLTNLDIPVVHNLPVGNSLQNHLTLPLFLATPILDEPPLEESIKNFTQGIRQRRGPFGDQGMLPLTKFANTVPGNISKTPDIEYHYFFITQNDLTTLNSWTSFAGLDNYYINALQKVITAKNLLIIESVLAHPKSTGKVELRSDNYADSPKISANYLDTPEDVETLLSSIKYVTKQLKTTVKVVKIPTPQCYTKPLLDDNYWRCYMKYMAMPQVNHVGTVKMGLNKKESCVNSDLLVHGVRNLRVADASIMPDIPSGEIHAATLMIGEKAADLIKYDWL